MGTRYLLALSLVSACALAYEVLLTRLFSIVQWHHFAFLVISLALLGYGASGIVIALTRESCKRYFAPVILVNLLLFALAMPTCFLLAQQVPFNPMQLLWDPMQLVYQFAVYLLLSLPFFFAANIIGLSFYRFRHQATRIYAADLLGAASGSLLIIVLLFVLFPQQGLLVLPLLALTAGVLLLQSLTLRRPWHRRAGAVMLFAVTLPVLVLPSHISLNMSPYKDMQQLLNLPETRVVNERSSPLGLLSVLRSDAVPVHHAPGLGIAADSVPPAQLALFTDGDGMSAITRFNGDLATIRYLGQMTSALPYRMRDADSALILGAGTGGDVLQALLFGVEEIHAVEHNPQILELLTRDHAAFAGDIYALPQIRLHRTDARAFVAGSAQRFDLINLSMLGGAGAAAGGLYSMAENYLQTREAMALYLSRLSPDGYLAMTHWTSLPPRVMPRLLSTLIAAMQQLGIAEPHRRIAIIRSWQTATLVVKNGALTNLEIERLRQFSAEYRFDLVHYPGMPPAEANRFHRLPEAYLYQSAMALLGDEAEAYIDSYKFNIQAVRDDRPYFSQFFKWSTLSELLSLRDQGGLFLLESAYLLLVIALLQALLAGCVLLLLPLWLGRRRLGIRPDDGVYRRVLVYFFALGLAFLFIEIAFIQKLILILQHPVYAITTVLTTFLIAAGLGSYLSGRWQGISLRRRVQMAVAAIAVLSLIYTAGFAPISGFLLQQPDVARHVLTVLLILPLGLCMGVPFPSAINALGERHALYIPWAWGINGLASVISPVLATLIAMQFGFRVLIAVAVAFYLLAAIVFPQRAE